MKRHVSLVAMLLLLGTAACDDGTGPVKLASFYVVASADGAAVPVRSFWTFSNTAGTCVYDLIGGTLTFSTANNYTLSFSYDVRCAGDPAVTRAHDSTMGKYTQLDDEVTLTPNVHGTFTVERVRLQSGAATVDVRMNSGSSHRFRFVESS